MNIPPTETSTYWKARYASVLDELDQNIQDRQRTETLLSRLILSMGTAVKGFDPVIDPHLEHIRELIKKGEFTDPIRSQLEAVAESFVLAARKECKASEGKPREDGLAVMDDGSLFAFFQSFMRTEEESNALAAVRKKFEHGEFADQTAMYRALEDFLGDLVVARAGTRSRGDKLDLLSRLFGKSAGKAGKVDIGALAMNLVELLDAVDTPRTLQVEANDLRESLKAELEGDEFLRLFKAVVGFLVKVKTAVETEKETVEGYLGELTNTLIDLEQQTQGIFSMIKDSNESSTNLHLMVADHVETLKKTANNTEDLALLKLRFSSRLEMISNYLRHEREIELKRIQETERKVEKLTERLHDLEMETSVLHNKLRVERHMTMRDALTGLPNRTAFDERVGQEVARWRRYGQPLCMLVWDIDYFKSINDRFGHKAGDKALNAIAGILSSSIRETDFVGRFGGEEFVMILTGMEEGMALKVAEGIRAKVESFGFNSQGKPVKITISCGISQFRQDDNADQVFERADQALYKAKHQGRNCCIVAG